MSAGAEKMLEPRAGVMDVASSPRGKGRSKRGPANLGARATGLDADWGEGGLLRVRENGQTGHWVCCWVRLLVTGPLGVPTGSDGRPGLPMVLLAWAC